MFISRAGQDRKGVPRAWWGEDCGGGEGGDHRERKRGCSRSDSDGQIAEDSRGGGKHQAVRERAPTYVKGDDVLTACVVASNLHRVFHRLCGGWRDGRG